MDKIAFLFGETFVYWNSIILTMAAACAICLFLGFYLAKLGRPAAAAAAIPVAMVLSLIIGRFIHWYCRADSYAGVAAAMTDYTTGGYALLGAFLGCVITAGILRLIRVSNDLPAMLDAMGVSGAAGIAVGRLAYFYSASDRGVMLESLQKLPWAYPVTNSVSGELEYRLATFLIQAMTTGVVFLVLAAWFWSKKRKNGDIALLFLLLYCACQTVLDSTRYDSLFMRSNGFISIVQLLSAITIVAVAVVFSVKLVMNRGFHWAYAVMWLALAGLMGGAGYMEYYVQRHGDLASFSYSVMSACISVFVVISLVIYGLGLTEKKYVLPAEPEVPDLLSERTVE